LKFANVVFNLPINSSFSYSIPKQFQEKIKMGMKVLAPFGRRNHTGIVLNFLDKPEAKRIKPLKELLDDQPIITAELIIFCEWISNYYACPIGEAVFTAVPRGKSLKPKFEKYVIFNLADEFRGYSNSMLENFSHENKLRSEKQAAIIRYFVGKNAREIRQAELTRIIEAPASAINALVKKELLSIEARRIMRSSDYDFAKEEKIVRLNSDQVKAVEKITEGQSKEFKPFLLFGVTGSGKTQIYLEVIKKTLLRGRTAIVLVPEISLTPQLIHRFHDFFGDIIGVIHSKISEGERFDVYHRIRNGEIKIVIGARSALFAPMEKIGIIIVDEEHDHSYKQTEKNPKYNARDCAVVRGKMNNSVVVLGSATPSLESFYNAAAGKYELLELPHRAMKTRQPVVEVVNMLEEVRFPSTRGPLDKRSLETKETLEQKFLSSKLIAYIDEALKEKQSIILLQNRRGYSAYLECQNCGNVKMCANCDITMIYHRVFQRLRCHYCGASEAMPEICPKCASKDLALKGTGTEKVEEEIVRLFPNARIKRMDADTVKRRDAYRKILKAFHEQEFDILVGTQMISKGLDFPNVYLVGVISADIGLLNPDFRASERTFQLLMQVAGRSGRISDYGRVVIQTMHPDNYIFDYVKNHNYRAFYDKEIGYRKEFDYPPYSRMTLVEIRGDDAGRVKTIAGKVHYQLTKAMKALELPRAGVEIMNPSPALIYKLKGKYRYHIILKVLREKGHQCIQSLISHLEAVKNELGLKSNEQIGVDVDAMNFG
jgi:primosomal protein N' (replication factor Y)